MNTSREFIKADSSFIGAVGDSLTTQTTAIGLQANVDANNLLLSTNFAA